MKPALILAAAVSCLMMATAAVHAAPWHGDTQATGVSERRIQECTDAADAKKLKGFEREKFIKQCAKGSN